MTIYKTKPMKTKEQFVIKFDTGQYLSSILLPYILDTCKLKKDAQKSPEKNMKNIALFLNKSGYTCSMERVGK